MSCKVTSNIYTLVKLSVYQVSSEVNTVTMWSEGVRISLAVDLMTANLLFMTLLHHI